MENFLPFTDDVMVVLVHKCVQQTHLLALHLETLGYIPRLLNALNGLVYFLIIGDPRGDNLMVGSISRKLLTELGIRTEKAKSVGKIPILTWCTFGVLQFTSLHSIDCITSLDIKSQNHTMSMTSQDYSKWDFRKTWRSDRKRLA